MISSDRIRRLTAALLGLCLLFGLTACGGSGKRITCAGCTIDGAAEVSGDGKAHTAVAVLPKGMTVDHWEINDVTAAAAGGSTSFEFTADFDGHIKAVLRPEKTVTAVNARIRFLNGGEPGGDEYESFVFENDYINPVTGNSISGGYISFMVTADVPEGYEVDYWLINGTAYLSCGEEYFYILGLTDSATYEAVLKKQGTEGAFGKSFLPIEKDEPEAVKPSGTYYPQSGNNNNGGGSNNGTGYEFSPPQYDPTVPQHDHVWMTYHDPETGLAVNYCGICGYTAGELG